jgi:Dolichyl-phosphate-mannose-protein mannosyltransferase
MILVLRRIVWSDGYSRPDDYNVIQESQIVGRIYRMNSAANETWRWTQIGLPSGPNGGFADSLEEAEAAFRAASQGHQKSGGRATPPPAATTWLRQATEKSGHDQPMNPAVRGSTPAVVVVPVAAASVAARKAHVCDRLALILLALATCVAILVFRDYGLGWDDFAHAEYGERLVAFYGSGFTDQRALSFVNLYMYGGGFDLLAALAAKVLPLDLFDVRRLAGAVVGLIGLFVTWRIGRRIGGPAAGVIALLLLAACPTYVGHVFMNAKDGPFAVAMVILLLGTVRVIEEYPQPSAGSTGLFGVGLGLAIGSRVLGGFGVISAMAGLALVFAVEARREGLRCAVRRAGRLVLALVPALALGYAILAIIWPWGVVDPLNPLRAVEYFSHFFEKPWHERFAGHLEFVTEMPRSYLPTLLALKLPELLLLLGFGGAAGAFVSAFRGRIPPNRRAVRLAVLLAAMLPIAATVATRPAMYNGIRHFVFIVPPLAVLGGVAGAWIWEKLPPPWAWVFAIVVIAGIASPVIEIVRLHPYEYTHFNRIAGGVGAARDKYMLDYWALSFKQASQGLAARIKELGLKQPLDRPWKLAVCGPHRSPQVELGPQFETTWDPKGAEFAMMLGEFYCLKLGAPLLVEVEREGAVYARVYDIRHHSYPTLLTFPGL